ncbi:MAG: AAA family ATPase [Treponema sp.]|nr:AAA family ATPase [Treponema sp.]
MYEAFFNFLRSPFARDIPCDQLYSTPGFDELHARLNFCARTRKFCVVTGDVGTGKTTAMRKFVSSLDGNLFNYVYISDSALTPRVFYWEVLKKFINLEKPCFYRSEGKQKMMGELNAMLEQGRQIPVIIIDEAHLLSHEMLEETRFLLNYKMDSQNPMCLIIVGQNDLRIKLSKEIYEPICQRIDHRFKLSTFDRAQTQEYIDKHLAYAGENRQIFSDSAIAAVFDYSNGSARKINKLCELALMTAAQKNTRIIEDSLVRFVIEQELSW